MVSDVVKEDNLNRLLEKAIRAESSLRDILLLTSNAPWPNLDNHIHPIFAFDSFENVTQLEYMRINWALRLASLFLTEYAVLDWFVHAAFDFPTTMPNTDPPQKCLEQRTTYNSGHYASVKDALVQLAEFVTFRWANPKSSSCAVTVGLVSSNRKPSGHINFLIRKAAERTTVQLRLHPSFLNWISYGDGKSGYTTATHSMRLRYSFFLAATLVHEVAHAFGIMVRGDSDEPFFSLKDTVAEWGESWEMFVFGSRIFPWAHKIAPTPTLLSNAWLTRDMTRACGGYERCVVPMDWVATWFQKTTWQHIARGQKVPPAVSDLRIWTDIHDKCRLMAPDELVSNKASKKRPSVFKETGDDKPLIKRLCRNEPEGVSHQPTSVG